MFRDFLTLVSAVLFLSACASPSSTDFGEQLYASHAVSMAELIGQADWYDGEPVSVTGVADFTTQFESTSGLFASTEDYEVGTFAFVFLEFPDETLEAELETEGLSGHWVLVEGVFRAMSKSRLPHPDCNQGDGTDEVHCDVGSDGRAQIVTTCQGICGAPGYI